ncbi:hypothetical protein FGE12_07355 [Aggregicoccus sp. 17bor-14]|uniref:hypothetical protein n=1 Tax=Myxococcaceae TaxID=31 RepID=UPI00129C7DC5|nr:MULTISPECIES: hypothetical protein [Myxococcaceae]MBF5042209.1 hypothetical protein [Simulacricoccus sp. 17bor-14]MRI87985.1 hypothetical protein [Aggregicoccus sp. 17bor-14]
MSSSRSLVASSLAALLLASAGCDSPPVVPTADLRQNTETARIEGQVVVQSQVRGDVIVLLYAKDRPPPPAGSGRPISFTIVPMEKVFGQELDKKDATGKYTAGPFVAPFAFSLVPEGKYLVRGFVDADTCRRVAASASCHGADFNPFYGVTGEPNQFDVGGAAVDLNDPKRGMLVVSVERGSDGKLVPALGVSVSFSDTATVPFDRPAFEASAPVTLAPGTQGITLKPLKVAEGGVNEAPPAFFVRYVDDNGDGVPDDANGDGAPDLWPRVVVRKLSSDKNAVPLLTDENDLDRNGILDAEGASYTTTDGSPTGPALVVMAAGLVPNSLYPLLNNDDGTPKKNPDGSFYVAAVPSLTVAVRNLALNAASGAPKPLTSVPVGNYSVLLMNFTGQTWKVPNELAPPLAPNMGFPSVQTQAFTYAVTAAP